MAYSEDKTWAFSRDQIIEAALRKIGEYDAGDVPSALELTNAQFALNAMVREWTVTDGIGLWLRQRCILILNPGKWRYVLGPGGTTGTNDDFHCFVDTELVENTILTDEAAAQTVISIEDDDWIDYAKLTAAKPTAGGENIGIMLDDGSIHWSTVAADGADTLTIAAGLPSAASAGNRVYTYVNRLPRPHGIVEIVRENTTGSTATNELIGRREYEQLSLKTSAGPPTKAHFDPRLDAASPALNHALLHVWPVNPDPSWMKLIFVGEFYPDEIDGATDNPQFPDEWANALIWNLADELADEYEIDIRRMNRIERKAAVKYNNLAWGADREEASFVMGRNTSGEV